MLHANAASTSALHRRTSLWLTVSAAALLATVCATDSAHAEPGACIVVGTTATCTGDHSAGIAAGPDFTSPPVATLVVRDITAAVRPGERPGPIGGGIPGILFLSDFVPVVTILANFLPFDIITRGDFAQGVAAATSDGNVVITSTVNIATNGFRSHGVNGAVGGTGNITITQTGNIETAGRDSDGVLALLAESQGDDVPLGTGNATITSTGNITVTGELSAGLSALTGRGNAAITSTGNIISRLDNGIEASTDTGNAVIDSTGDVISNGVDSGALLALARISGTFNITSEGDLSTTGNLSEAIGAVSTGTGTNRIESRGDITTTGNGAHGIFAETNGGILNVSSVGNITTGGSAAEGIAMRVNGNAASSLIHIGDITTAGAAGIRSTVTGNGAVQINASGNIEVIGGPGGIGNGGIVAEAGGTGLLDILSTAAIRTTANDSAAIVANGAGSGGVRITSTGNLTVSGADGVGILAINPAGGTTTINTLGEIRATGQDGYGIEASAATGQTVTVNIEGGLVQGGTGGGVGIGLLEAATPGVYTGRVNIAAGAAVSALSGFAIGGLGSNDSIVNLGRVTGDVILGGGANRFENGTGALFETGGQVRVGNAANPNALILNSGTVAPGGDGVIGTTAMTGLLRLVTGGTYSVDIAADNTGDRIDVIGGITLGGALVLNPLGLLTGFSATKSHVILTATGGITGTFGSIIDNLPDLDVIARVIGGSQVVLDFGGGPLDGCSTTAGVTRCVGNLSGGVTNTGGAPQITDTTGGVFVIDRLSAQIRPPSGRDGVFIQANDGQGIDLTVNTGTLGIATSGREADGIRAIDAAGAEGVRVVSTGNITTSGIISNGIVAAAAAGDVTIVSTGDILANENGSGAIKAQANNGNVSITSTGALQTNGQNLVITSTFERADTDVVHALTGDGNITIVLDGPLTQTEASNGVFAEAVRSGNIAITTTGDITTDAAAGINAITADGDIVVTARGNLTNQGTSFGGQIEATSQAGDVTIDLIGDLVTSRFPGSGIEAESRLGDVTIRMRGNVVENDFTIATSTRAGADLGATAGVGDVLIDYAGSVGGSLTGLSENGSVTINSVGDLTSNVPFDAVIRARTGTDSNGAASTLPGGDITISSVGDITSIASSSVGLISATLGAGANGNITITSTGDLVAAGRANSAGIEGTTTYQLLSGVETGHGDVTITSTGDITLTGASATGIRGVVGADFDRRSGADGDVTILSDGTITVGGTDGVGINARVSAGSVADITVEGGAVTGGSGAGSGISFGPNPAGRQGFVGTFAGSEAGSTNRVTIAADGSVGAASGLAIRGSDGDEDIRLDGRIDGYVELGNGADRLTLRAGAVLDGTVEFGDGTDTLAFDGAAGTTGNIALFSDGTSFANGFEVIEKRGAGTWVFAGDDLPAVTPPSTARILEGTAVVYADFATVAGIVSAGARLMGTGGSGTLQNSGTFAPGGSIGAFSVTGNLTLNTPGTLEIEIASDNRADRVNVSGATVLGGTLRVAAEGLLTAFSATNVYQVIDSIGGITGSFAAIIDNLPDLDVVVSVVNGGRTLQLSLAGTVAPPTEGCNPAIAANGGSVVCTGTDPDGFQSASTAVDVTVLADATVTSAAPGSAPVALGADGVIVNRGTITAGPALTAVQALTGAQTSVLNEGTITNQQPGQNGIAGIRASGTTVNRGTVQVSGANGVTGIHSQTDASAANFATIAVTSDADGAGMRGGGAGTVLRNEASGTITLAGGGSGIAAADGALVVNQGTIRVTGGFGAGITLSGQGSAQSLLNAGLTVTDGPAALLATTTGATLTNTGTLRATAATAAGVDLGTGTGNRVDNRGLIEGGAQGLRLTGVTAGAPPQLTVENAATGVIRANAGGGTGIEVSGGALDLTNAGTIAGGAGGLAVRSGGGADRVVLRTGSALQGGVDLGAGDDLLVHEAGATLAGGLDFGLGDDRLELVATTGQTGILSFGSAMAGLETVTTTGAGGWQFTGADTLATDPMVTATFASGSTRLTANLRNLRTTVASGARLDGTGGSGALTNNGTFAPGTSIGTFRVAGDLTLNAPGTLEVEIASNNTSDLVQVSGATQLGGTLAVQALGAQTAFSTANTYLVLHSDGGIAGAFANITDTLPDLDVSAQIVDAGRGLQLGLVAGTTPVATSDKTVIPNALQGAVAGARSFGLTMADHGLTAGEPAFWFTGLVTRETLPTVAGSKTSFRTGGFALGTGRRLTLGDGGDLVLGLSLGRTDVDVTSGPSSAGVQGWHVGAYAQYDRGPLRLQGALSHGVLDYDLSREIAIAGAAPVTARGQTKGQASSLSFGLSYDIAPALGLADTRLAPLLRVEHATGRMGGYTETGAGLLNLAVNPARYRQTWVGVGLQVSSRIVARSGMVFRPDLELRIDRAVGARNATVTSSIAQVAGADFITDGTANARTRATLRAGVSFDLGRGATARVEYNGTFARKAANHGASATLSIRF
jgi:uncharacterized protein with beta-barrel porin domain